MKTALFLGHGSPMNVLRDNAYNRAFRQMGAPFCACLRMVTATAHG